MKPRKIGGEWNEHFKSKESTDKKYWLERANPIFPSLDKLQKQLHGMRY